MNRLLGRLAAFVLCTTLTGCDNDSTNGGGVDTDSGTWSGIVAAGDDLGVNNVSGSINAAYTSDTEVRVQWTKTGDRDDFSSVEVRRVSDANGVSFSTVYLANNVNVGVNFAVEVPSGVGFVANNVSGNVDATNLRSDILATVVSGNATLSTSELVEANVVSGSIDATIGRADWGRDLEFAVQSGNLTLTVPSNTNAEVTATVISGTITSDFALAGSPTHQDGILGSGGDALTLSVISGNIILLSGAED